MVEVSLSTSSSEMKQGLKSFFFVLVLALLVDRLLGFGFERLYKRTMSGEAGGLINAALSAKAQVLLLGSSRMMHHVDPAVVSHYLSLSVYNAGINGHDLLYALMLMDLRRREGDPPPEAVVLHVDENSFAKNEDELKRTSIFSFYYTESDLVREVIDQRTRLEPIKYASMAYRANGKVLPILKNVLSPEHGTMNGYSPLNGIMKAPFPAEASEKMGTKTPPLGFWDFKVRCFERFLQNCRQEGTRVFLLHSPRFSESRSEHDGWIASINSFLARFPEVQFIEINEFTYPQVFGGRPELFQDNTHLNAKGAAMLSDLLATKLQASFTNRPAVAN